MLVLIPGKYRTFQLLENLADKPWFMHIINETLKGTMDSMDTDMAITIPFGTAEDDAISDPGSEGS